MTLSHARLIESPELCFAIANEDLSNSSFCFLLTQTSTHLLLLPEVAGFIIA